MADMSNPPSESSEKKSEGGKTDSEQKKGEDRASISAAVVHAAIKKEGESELRRPSSALAWSGLAAGLSMSFSLISQGLIREHLPEVSWAPLLSAFGYSVGFLIVVLGRQQLFTENTLTAVVPVLEDLKIKSLFNMLRLWAIVLITNLIGVFIVVAVIANTSIFSPETRAAFTEIGQKAMQYSFITTLLKGIFAGWLIALMAWLLPAAESARIWVIIIITYIVGLGGLSHIVAGSAETFYLVVNGNIPFIEYLAGFMLPSLIGNIIGGVTIVAAINHAQVVSGSREG
jgi:formate-nitrite transporter family protein